MPETHQCTLGTQNKTDIANLKEDVDEMRSDIKEIKDKLLSRPSWFVTVVITALVGALCTMSMYILTH